MIFYIGFMHKEMDKADVVVQDSDEIPEAPHPNEMMELEVFSIVFLFPNPNFISGQS